LEIRETISTFPTLPLRRCLTPLRVCETNQCVCERSKPALLKSVWKCELLSSAVFVDQRCCGLHYGQELVSTNRPDTFAQTKPPTTTILLAISRRTIQFPWPVFVGLGCTEVVVALRPGMSRAPYPLAGIRQEQKRSRKESREKVFAIAYLAPILSHAQHSRFGPADALTLCLKRSEPSFPSSRTLD
jgi:hypothetical protein